MTNQIKKVQDFMVHKCLIFDPVKVASISYHATGQIFVNLESNRAISLPSMALRVSLIQAISEDLIKVMSVMETGHYLYNDMIKILSFAHINDAVIEARTRTSFQYVLKMNDDFIVCEKGAISPDPDLVVATYDPAQLEIHIENIGTDEF